MSNSSSEIDPRIKTIIETVLDRCKKEKDNGALQVPLENVLSRVSYYTGLPTVLINQTFESENGITNLSDKINMWTTISVAMLKFYATGYFPTISDVHQSLDKTLAQTMTFDQVASLLTLLGYHYKETIPTEKLLLIEKPKITFERTHYLKKIKKLRQSTVNILYLGERVINAKNISEKLWPDYNEKVNTAAIINEEFILYHIVARTGLKYYLFTNCISSADFDKWLTDIVLPALEPNTAIILENNLIHPNAIKNQITEYHSKADMLTFLKENDIPCSNNLSKAEMFNLIQLCAKAKPYNSHERLLHAYGHHYLFLPQKFQSLSMIDLLWEHIQKICEVKNDASLIHVKGYIEDILKNKISREVWQELHEKVISNETFVQQLDEHIEAAIEMNYKFKLDTLDKEKHIEFDI